MKVKETLYPIAKMQKYLATPKELLNNMSASRFFALTVCAYFNERRAMVVCPPFGKGKIKLANRIAQSVLSTVPVKFGSKLPTVTLYCIHEFVTYMDRYVRDPFGLFDTILTQDLNDMPISVNFPRECSVRVRCHKVLGKEEPYLVFRENKD